MAVELGKKISLAELNKNKESKKEEDVGFFESALAGVATGLWNIPKGFVSLGAELYDLAADTDKAKEVEAWFDEVFGPLDEVIGIGKKVEDCMADDWQEIGLA